MPRTHYRVQAITDTRSQLLMRVITEPWLVIAEGPTAAIEIRYIKLIAAQEAS